MTKVSFPYHLSIGNQPHPHTEVIATCILVAQSGPLRRPTRATLRLHTPASATGSRRLKPLGWAYLWPVEVPFCGVEGVLSGRAM